MLIYLGKFFDNNTRPLKTKCVVRMKVLAGVPFVNEVFRAVGCSVTWHMNEGDEVNAEEARGSLTISFFNFRFWPVWIACH